MGEQFFSQIGIRTRKWECMITEILIQNIDIYQFLNLHYSIYIKYPVILYFSMLKDHSFKRELSLKDQIFNTQTKLAHTLKKFKPHIIIILIIIPYFQFLAFSFDKFSFFWFSENATIFGYLDLSTYMK